MKKIRLGIIVIAVILIGIQLFFINYQDLAWNENSASYLGILALLLILASLAISYFQEKKKSK